MIWSPNAVSISASTHVTHGHFLSEICITRVLHAQYSKIGQIWPREIHVYLGTRVYTSIFRVIEIHVSFLYLSQQCYQKQGGPCPCHPGASLPGEFLIGSFFHQLKNTYQMSQKRGVEESSLPTPKKKKKYNQPVIHTDPTTPENATSWVWKFFSYDHQ